MDLPYPLPDNKNTISNAISAKIKSGELTTNNAQTIAIAALDELLVKINNTKQNIFTKLFQKQKNENKGIYIWGGVGGGKTMLMDLFFENIVEPKKQRKHFHAFMLDLHKTIHNWRQKNNGNNKNNGDPIPIIAKKIAVKNKIICLDEFSVTDAADAMILARLFTNLWQHNVIVITTSNTKPDDLYKDGLNRQWFLPFIELVKTEMKIIHLDTKIDHRKKKLQKAKLYIYGKDSLARFNKLWQDMTDGLAIQTTELHYKKRTINFRQTCGGIVRENFTRLCQSTPTNTPFGVGDYLAMATRFHTLFLEDLPTLQSENRNDIKRFINLIDTWYDKQKIIIIQAKTTIDEIYQVKQGNLRNNIGFEFQRTISRLNEMQSKNYLSLHK